jgi:hypothetical protein
VFAGSPRFARRRVKGGDGIVDQVMIYGGRHVGRRSRPPLAKGRPASTIRPMIGKWAEPLTPDAERLGGNSRA